MGENPAQQGAKGARETGILVLDKPSGLTSRTLVDRVVRLIPRVKVGHAGTLDPLATGLLIVCIGAATRLVEMLQQLPKSYQTKIRLGARSDTLDAEGQIVIDARAPIPSRNEVQRALSPLVGRIIQKPPDYSALKLKGQRAYDLARAGHAVELAPRLVQIDRIAVLRYTWPSLELEIDCGSGTYIRAIARDLGEALACGGYVETLVRTRIGPFTLEQAVDPSTLTAESIERHLRPALDAVPGLPRLVLDPHQLEAVAHGRRLPVHDLVDPPFPAGQVALLDPDGTLVALGEFDPEGGWLQPRKVLV